MLETTNIASTAQIHRYAEVHPDAIIGEGVVIGPFVTIDQDVMIGDGTKIETNAVIYEGTRIGSNCRIFPGAVIGAVPQDLKFIGEYSTTEIGNDTTIREYATINRGTIAEGKTVIGSNCLIMAYVHVAHDCIVGDHVILVNNVNLAGEVKVEDWAILGGMTGVHQFCTIGKHAMVSGGSLVRKDIPPFIKAGREPVSYAGINSVGLRRRDFSRETINEIQDIYRFIYQKGINTSDALNIIEKEMTASAERDDILEFIRNSTRGIIPGI